MSLPRVNTAAPSSRRSGLDALRGLAVVLMINQHVGIWMWHGRQDLETPSTWAAFLAVNALGGMAAPLFITLAGVGAALYAATGRPSATLVRRGVAIVAFGMVLNALAATWFSAASWFVLHLIGVAVALAAVWRRMRTPALLALAVALLVATPVAQAWLDTPVPLDNARMSDGGLPGGALRLALFEGHFPVLPWLALAVVGFVAGRWLAAGRLAPIVWLAAAGGGVCLGGWVVAGNGAVGPEPLQRAFAVHPFYPASLTVVLALGALCLVLVAAVTAYERRRPLPASQPLVTLGRASLTLLLVHVPLFREVTQVAGWYRTLPALLALAVVGAVLAGAAVATTVWRAHGFRYGAEWWLRRLDGSRARAPRPPDTRPRDPHAQDGVGVHR